MSSLKGKVVVITGAGSGMAKASARRFVREGAKVLAADVSGREKETASELGSAVIPFHCDVTQEADVVSMFEAAVREFGQVDAVLNVAGIFGPEPLAEISMEQYDNVMAVNLKGVMLGTKHGIRTMLASGGGSIVNWSSIGGLNGTARPGSVYAATKAGVIAFTKAAAVEYGPQGIRANAICPGLIVTELIGGAEALEKYPHHINVAPLKRAGQPEEVAELAAFLASDRSSYITGAVIPIDGGTTASLP